MFKKTDKPPVPLLSPVRSTLRDTLCWSWIEVEPHDKHGKNVCVDYLLKSEDSSRESDQRWQVEGWLLACYNLTIVFPGRQLTNFPHCFWVFRLSGVEGSRVLAVLATYQPSQTPHAFRKKQYSRTLKFLIKKLDFLFVIYPSFKGQTIGFSILQTNPTISRTIFLSSRLSLSSWLTSGHQIHFSLSSLVLDLHHPNPHLSIFNATAMTVSIRVFTAAYSGAGHQLSFWDTSISITFIRNLHFWSWTVSISIFTAPYSGVRASAVRLGRNIRSTEQGAGAGPKQYK